jgi:hypothetical protein
MATKLSPSCSRTFAKTARLGLVLVGLLLALGCATSGTGAKSEETASVSASRCAPGRVLDDRHSTCNGVSGRWW